MADQELIKNIRTLNKTIARDSYVRTLFILSSIGAIDNKELREQLKAITESNGFKTDQSFWTRDLY